MPTAVSVRPAATVVVLRDGPEGLEVLLVRRSAKLVFHGGAWVFPGGQIDVEAGETDDEVGARAAAVREVREEAGLALDPAGLVALSHWTTPEGQPRRFATWFYLVASDGAAVQVDGGEVQDHRWATPAAALAAQRGGEIDLPPPTFVTLSVLAGRRSSADALDAAAAEPPLVYLPRIVSGRDGRASLYPGDAGWESCDAEREGARHRLLFHPSGWRYLRSASGGGG